MNARQAAEQNEILTIQMLNGAKEMAVRFDITVEEAIDRKVKAYVKYAKSETEQMAWELRGEDAKKLNNPEPTELVIENAKIKRSNGYGQYIVTGVVNGVEVTARTTDSEAFDWFNDDENEEKHLAAINHVNCKLEQAYENL